VRSFERNVLLPGLWAFQGERFFIIFSLPHPEDGSEANRAWPMSLSPSRHFTMCSQPVCAVFQAVLAELCLADAVPKFMEELRERMCVFRVARRLLVVPFLPGAGFAARVKFAFASQMGRVH
jgi:hypothetical protein